MGGEDGVGGGGGEDRVGGGGWGVRRRRKVGEILGARLEGRRCVMDGLDVVYVLFKGEEDVRLR